MASNEILILSPEIFLRVFDYLTLAELKIARFVCREWYEISHKILPKKCEIQLHTTECVLSKDFHEWIKNHNDYYQAFKLKVSAHLWLDPVSLIVYSKIWEDFGENLKHIFFDGVCMDCNEFIIILLNFPNLHSLQIGRIKHTPRVQHNLPPPEERKEFMVKLGTLCFNNLKSFKYCLNGNDIFNGDSFEKFSNSMPQLEIFQLYTFWEMNPFYTHTVDIATWPNVLVFIKNVSKTLKTLRLEHEFVDSDEQSFCMLSDLMLISDLNLKSFMFVDTRLNAVKNMENDIVLANFLSKHQEMEDICISHMKMNLTNTNIILRSLPKLKILNFSCCNPLNVNEYGPFLEPTFTKPLKEISFNKRNYNFEIILSSIDPYNLRALSYYHDMMREPIRPVLKCLNLKVLDIQMDRRIFDGTLYDSDVQMIIVHLTGLEELGIHDCSKLTDAALYDIQTGICISNLKNLKRLQLRDCYKMTDIVFYDIIKLKYLRDFHFTYSQIEDFSINLLFNNCIYLEYLNFTGCLNLSKDVGLFSHHQLLNLKRCTFHLSSLGQDNIVTQKDMDFNIWQKSE